MSGEIERIGWAVRLAFGDGDVRWTWPNTGGMWTEKRAVREADAWAEDGYDAKAMPLYAGGTIEALEAERDRYRDLADRLKLEAQIHAGEARCQTHTVHECYQAASGATGERGNWHGAQPVRERIASLEAERDELRATVERYREALFAVDDVEECDSCPPDRSCGCALNRAREIARDALMPALNPTEET